MTENEYKKVLFELGIITDDEDWKLFMEQEKRFDPVDDEENELWMEYLTGVNHGARKTNRI